MIYFPKLGVGNLGENEQFIVETNYDQGEKQYLLETNIGQDNIEEFTHEETQPGLGDTPGQSGGRT